MATPKPPASANQDASVKRSLVRRVRVDRAGRVVVPVAIRKALDIHAGQELTISLDDNAIRLQTMDAALAQVWAIAQRRGMGGGTENTVDDFIAERRAEAAKE